MGQTDDDAGNTPALRRIALHYPGTCSRCSSAIEKGAEALFDDRARTVQCLRCPTEADEQPNGAGSGTAGASARREYERRMRGREARITERFGPRFGRVVLAVTSERQSTKAWERGAIGEEDFAKTLADLEGIRVLHDRRVTGTRGNIDHLIVAPAGVFVVDAKHYRGLIRVRDVGGLFKRDVRLYVGSRDCSKLAVGMDWQVQAVERALESSPGEPAPTITPVLCFVDGQWPLLRRPHAYSGVRLEDPRSIRKLITANRTLDDADIDRIAGLLAKAFPPK